METAGKQMEDEELRDLMKENGIGRPSTRANIIETLYKRNYMQKEKKNIVPTETGISLINTIKNELLKSAELTGQWEKRLRMIEHSTYDTSTFMSELKEMVTQIIQTVKYDNNQRIALAEEISKVRIHDQLHRHQRRCHRHPDDWNCDLRIHPGCHHRPGDRIHRTDIGDEDYHLRLGFRERHRLRLQAR